jgi:hypothetical protein
MFESSTYLICTDKCSYWYVFFVIGLIFGYPLEKRIRWIYKKIKVFYNEYIII